MKAPGVYVYASQSLMKGTYTASVLERELWGLWEPFAGAWAEVQVQNPIQAFAGGRLQAFAGLWAEVQIRLQVRL